MTKQVILAHVILSPFYIILSPLLLLVWAVATLHLEYIEPLDRSKIK